MATVISTTDEAWTALGTGKSKAIIQATGNDAEVFIGSTTPTDEDDGFRLPQGVAVNVPGIAAFGGGVWVRGTGAIRYDIV